MRLFRFNYSYIWLYCRVDLFTIGNHQQCDHERLLCVSIWLLLKSLLSSFKVRDREIFLLIQNICHLSLNFFFFAGGQEGRGKKNNMGPLLAAGAMKVGMMGILAFKALALLVGKALLVSKLAFLLAAIIGLKKLFSQQKHVTYEVVAHPHHSHSHVSEHGHGGGGDSYSSAWGRSIEPATSSDPQTLAYSAHAPK